MRQILTIPSWTQTWRVQAQFHVFHLPYRGILQPNLKFLINYLVAPHSEPGKHSGSANLNFFHIQVHSCIRKRTIWTWTWYSFQAHFMGTQMCRQTGIYPKYQKNQVQGFVSALQQWIRRLIRVLYHRWCVVKEGHI